MFNFWNVDIYAVIFDVAGNIVAVGYNSLPDASMGVSNNLIFGWNSVISQGNKYKIYPDLNILDRAVFQK